MHDPTKSMNKEPEAVRITREMEEKQLIGLSSEGKKHRIIYHDPRLPKQGKIVLTGPAGPSFTWCRFEFIGTPQEVNQYIMDKETTDE